jgi:hypothetical protein
MEKTEDEDENEDDSAQRSFVLVVLVLVPENPTYQNTCIPQYIYIFFPVISVRFV